jgi:hypothetical protein
MPKNSLTSRLSTSLRNTQDKQALLVMDQRVGDGSKGGHPQQHVHPAASNKNKSLTRTRVDGSPSCTDAS